MLTICPYPDCRHEHLYSSFESNLHHWTICPMCERPGALRSPEIWQGINARKALYAGQELVPDKIQGTNSSRVCCAVLEDIRSLWNVGSMFRTADAAGINRLFLAGITGSPPRKEIVKVSLGAEDHVSWTYLSHVLDVLPTLKELGVVIIALERCTKSKPLVEVAKVIDPNRKIALIVGNEVTGISPETLNSCDLVADLPMCGSKESLNVAVAFGVAVYALAFFLPNSNTSGSIIGGGEILG